MPQKRPAPFESTMMQETPWSTPPSSQSTYGQSPSNKRITLGETNLEECGCANVSQLHVLGIHETPEEFLEKPRKDRQSGYREILTHYAPLYLKNVILWDEDGGWTWKEDTELLPRGVPLLDLRQTGNAKLTQEAREFFYRKNLIVTGFDAYWLYSGSKEDEFDPALWLRRVQVVIHDEDFESTREWLEQTYSIFVSAVQQLMECDRLEYVVLEVRGSESEHVSALESLVAQEVDVLRELDKRIELGVLMVRECAWDPWGRCTQSQVVQFPWWDDEKTASMKELEDEWRGETGVQRSPPASWETVKELHLEEIE